MTLTTRLSLFFLAALAVVLIGFSLTLYLLASSYLHRQTDDRLDAAQRTLVAAVEISAKGVEWEPSERQLSLGRDAGEAGLRWVVRDDAGRPLSQSAEPVPDDVIDSWLVRHCRVTAQASAPPSPPAGGQDGVKYPFVGISVAAPLGPVTAKLRALALILAGTAAGLWLLAAALGRWFCRRALVPVTRMAGAAQAITADTLDLRLPRAGSKDELDQLSQAFNDLLGRLQESFERQRRFTGDASHQLRTPLTVMLGQADVALRRDRTPEEYRCVLGRLREQAVGLTRIVEMLLFLARADAEALAPQLEPVDLTAWLGEYFSQWSGHPRAADLRLECASPGPCIVQTHAALLRQLLDNLVENACKHTPARTFIVLRLSKEERFAAITVADHGPGIAAEDIPHLFEPFYRSPQARRDGVGGIGLGLAVAARIARALGGSLSVQSEPGGGARFTLQLPMAPLEDARPQETRDEWLVPA